MEWAIPGVILGIVVAFVVAGLLWTRYFTKVPPDKVAVFTGGHGFRVVTGGATLKRPVIERVDWMDLAPFEVSLAIRGAYSRQGVPVNVDAKALVRFDSSEEGLRTAAGRYLHTPRENLHRMIEEILSGHMRSVAATMTVEELNSNREALVTNVTEHAGTNFRDQGLSLDLVTIQHISDEQDYLVSLGRRSIAEVKRDAEIGEADAQRESAQRVAEAMRLGETARAAAAAAVAEAGRDRDIRIAKADAEVAAERARAAQAGPLAEAESRKAVATAEVGVEAERMRAEIELEQQRVARQQKTYEADVVSKADAERRATILRAEGEREAAMARAIGEAEARKRAAEAAQREMEAQGAGIAAKAEGESAARKLAADALQRELEAEGAGAAAKLHGEAEGQAALVEQLNRYTLPALQQILYPELVRRLPEIARQVAEPLKTIDNVVMFDSGSGGGPAGKWGGQVPLMLAQTIESLKAVGLDLGAILGRRAPSGPAPAKHTPENGAGTEADEGE